MSIFDYARKKAEMEAAEKRAMGIDKIPTIPKAKSPLTNAGVLADKYKLGPGAQILPEQLDLAKYAADPKALNQLKEYAMGKGPSPWLNMQMDAQRLQELTAMDQAGGQANASGAVARSALAMRGGLGGGAAERIAQNQGSALLAARQGIGRAGEESRLNLNIADQQQKMQALSQIPGMDVQFANQMSNNAQFNAASRTEAAKFNAGESNQNQRLNSAATLLGLDRDNQNAMDIYKTQMGGYGAEKTAQATKAGGKK